MLSLSRNGIDVFGHCNRMHGSFARGSAVDGVCTKRPWRQIQSRIGQIADAVY